MDFWICGDECERHAAWLGLTSRGFYPSTPRRPNYVISEDIFYFFHSLHMRGPSSKQSYCAALETFLRKKTRIPVQTIALN